METKPKTADEVHAIIMKMIANNEGLTIEDMELITIEARPKPNFLDNKNLFEIYGYNEEQVANSINNAVQNLKDKKVSDIEARYQMYNCEAYRLHAVQMMLSFAELHVPIRTTENIVQYIVTLPEPIKSLVISTIKAIPSKY